MTRCEWAGNEPIYIHYHDKEWGVPVYDDQTLFEFLILEGAQAGLSWITVLKKREHYRKVMNNFDPEKIVRWTTKKIETLLTDPGIIRNRLKVESTVKNAKAFLKIQEEAGSFSNYLWDYVDGQPIQNTWKTLNKVPTSTAISDALAKDLKKRGCSFVGTTICYAFMQAVGMVNDHTTDCFRHRELQC